MLFIEKDDDKKILTAAPPPADLLPAIDEKVVRKIKRGEFVDFTLCMPSFGCQERHPIVTPTVNSNGDPAWRVGSSSPRGKITFFSDWLVAWNTYVRCVTYFFPELVRQLFFYQSDITNMTRLYTFSSVMMFDRASRTRVLNKDVQRWDYHDLELRSAYLISLPRKTTTTPAASHVGVSCWSCGVSGSEGLVCF